jgi:XTP/dITP diphosphohydrolase
MLPKLIFATHNQNKSREIGAMLQGVMKVVSLEEIGFFEEIVESGSTLKENARIKAKTIFDHSHLNCFADDTGLEVEALNGAPGVYSARYAGLEKSAEKNNQKLIQALLNTSNKNARFVTQICLFLDGTEYFFEGELRGTIISDPRGKEGFGYDPIFVPFGSDRTLAEMSLAEKNTQSHRAKAFHQMIEFLKEKFAANSI